jgi:hypothetical protein
VKIWDIAALMLVPFYSKKVKTETTVPVKENLDEEISFGN